MALKPICTILIEQASAYSQRLSEIDEELAEQEKLRSEGIAEFDANIQQLEREKADVQKELANAQSAMKKQEDEARDDDSSWDEFVESQLQELREC